MNLKITRAIIDAIHENQLDNVEYEKSPVFGFDVPKTCPNVSSEILNPRNTWQNKVEKEKNQINFCFTKNCLLLLLLLPSLFI